MTGPRSATAAGSVRPRVPDVTASIAVHPHTVVACARHVHQAAWPPLPDDRQAAGRTEPGPAPRSRLRRPSAPRRRALARRERGWPHWRRVRTGGRWTEQHLLAGRPEAAAPSSSPGGQAPPTTAERADMARSELLASICPTLWELRTGRRSHVPPWFSSVEPPELDAPLVERIIERLDDFAVRWHALPECGSITLSWLPRNPDRTREKQNNPTRWPISPELCTAATPPWSSTRSVATRSPSWPGPRHRSSQQHLLHQGIHSTRNVVSASGTAVSPTRRWERTDPSTAGHESPSDIKSSKTCSATVGSPSPPTHSFPVEACRCRWSAAPDGC